MTKATPTKSPKPKAAAEPAKAAAASEPSSAETLHGSNAFASTYEIGDTTVQLGTLVMEAHKQSGLTVEQWNALPDADRDTLIGKVKDAIEARAATPSLDALDLALAAFIATMTWSPETTEDSKSLVMGNLGGFVGYLRTAEPNRLAAFLSFSDTPSAQPKDGGSGNLAAPAVRTGRPTDVVGYARREGEMIADQIDELLDDGKGAEALELLDDRLADLKAARPAIDAIEQLLKQKRISIGGDAAAEERIECWTAELIVWAGKQQPIGTRLTLPRTIFDKLFAGKEVTDQDPSAPKPETPAE